MQLSQKLGRALGPLEEFAHYQQGPFIADQLQRTGDWATINFASSHFVLRVAAELITVSSRRCVISSKTNS
jgi:hypothetical protein